MFLTKECGLGESPLTREETLDWGVREVTPSSWIFCRWSPVAAEKLLERRLLLAGGDCESPDVSDDADGACRCRCDGEDEL